MPKENRIDIKGFVMTYSIFFILLVLLSIIVVQRPDFMQIATFRDILGQSAVRIIIALGAMFIILGGTADLSAGRQLGMYSLLTGSMLQNNDYPTKFQRIINEPPLILPLLIIFGFALVIGMTNGLIITKLRVPAFIATLGVQYAIYGAGQLYYDMKPNNSQPIGGLMQHFRDLGTGSFGGPNGIQYTLAIAVTLCIASHVALKYTRFGKQLFAMGGNIAAARVSGIKTDWLTIAVYVIAALLYALAGYLEVARTGGATVNYGFGYEFDAIVSCTIGGVSISGGVGTVMGVFAGVIIFTTIAYGMNFIGIPAYYQYVVRGVVVVAAVAIDMRKYQRRN